MYSEGMRVGEVSLTIIEFCPILTSKRTRERGKTLVCLPSSSTLVRDMASGEVSPSLCGSMLLKITQRGRTLACRKSATPNVTQININHLIKNNSF